MDYGVLTLDMNFDRVSKFSSSRACAHVFQRESLRSGDSDVSADLLIANSTLASYVGLDRREGLVNIGRRLLTGNWSQSDLVHGKL